MKIHRFSLILLHESQVTSNVSQPGGYDGAHSPEPLWVNLKFNFQTCFLLWYLFKGYLNNKKKNVNEQWQ